jgi:hypothetical protein
MSVHASTRSTLSILFHSEVGFRMGAAMDGLGNPPGISFPITDKKLAKGRLVWTSMPL